MPENTAIATVENNAIAPAIDFNIPEGFICTVDTSTDAGAINAANALGAALSMSNYIDDKKKNDFIVVDVITKPGIRAVSNDPCTDVILILDDGTCLFTQSEGIHNSVQFMVAACGLEKIHRGVHVEVSEIKTRGGNSLKQLKMLGFAS